MPYPLRLKGRGASSSATAADASPIENNESVPSATTDEADSLIAEAIGATERNGTVDGATEVLADSDTWTGIASRTRRLIVLRGELEVAQAAVGRLIEELADDEGNGGPLIGEHAKALEGLRELHRGLGSLLDAIDQGKLTDELGDSLAAELTRFGQRALDDLRDDPARYVLAATAFAVLTASGLGAGAGFLAGAALRLTRKTVS